MRSGSQYTEALRDDRCVYLGSKRVRDIVNHPAFAGAIQTVSSLYDMALDPHNQMSYAPSDAAQPANKVFLIPRNREDLQTRRLASTRWAEITHGFFGRVPDHVAGFLAGFASAPAVFGVRRSNVQNY